MLSRGSFSGERGARSRPPGFCDSGGAHHCHLWALRAWEQWGPGPCRQHPASSRRRGHGFRQPRTVLTSACSLMCTCFPDTGLRFATVGIFPGRVGQPPPHPQRGDPEPCSRWVVGAPGSSHPMCGGGHSQLPGTSSKGTFPQNIHCVIVTLASFICSSTVSLNLS